MNALRKRRFCIIALSIIMAVSYGALFGASDDPTSGAPTGQSVSGGVLTKKFVLKYASPAEVLEKAKFLIFESSILNDSSILVTIRRDKLDAFQELLDTVDVEKKAILVQIVPIIATRTLPPGYQSKNPAANMLGDETDLRSLENKGLVSVLDEMKGLWNFRHFWVESPSYLTVREASGSYFLKLVSQRYSFNFLALHPEVRGVDKGRRSIRFAQIQLEQVFTNQEKSTLIDTHDVEVKENGYLVVGVGGTSIAGGPAVILVINAIIKDTPAASGPE